MKFKNEEDKMAALKNACHQWGVAMGEVKFLELVVREVSGGYADETPAQRMEKRTIPEAAPVAAPAPVTQAPAAEAAPATEEGEDKPKRVRRTKAEILADETAKAAAAAPVIAPTATAPVAAPAPVAAAPAAAPAPVAAAPAAAPAAPAITQKMVQELMGSLLVKLGNGPDARPKIVAVLKASTGKTKTAELTTPEEFRRAYEATAGALAALDQKDEEGDAL